MKKIVLILLAFISVNTVALHAEEPEAIGKPDVELTKKQAEVRIAEFNTRIQDLTNTQMSLDKEIQQFRAEIDAMVASLNDCNKAYYALVGATEADIAIPPENRRIRRQSSFYGQFVK